MEEHSVFNHNKNNWKQKIESRQFNPNACNFEAKDKRGHLGFCPEAKSGCRHLHFKETCCSYWRESSNSTRPRYSITQTHFMNELNNGRDIYPTDLTSTVSKANRWLVPSARGPTRCFQCIEVQARRQEGQENPRSQGYDKRSTSRQSGEVRQICKVRRSRPQHTCMLLS